MSDFYKESIENEVWEFAMKDTYNWYNIRTGEIVKSLFDVIKTEVYDLIHFHFIGIWVYRAKGF